MTWQMVPFPIAFADVTSDSPKIKQSEFALSGFFPVRDQGEHDVAGYWNDERDVTRVNRPLILFGDHTRRVKYADSDFVIGADGVKVLRPSPALDPRFAFHWMRSLDIPSAGYSRHFKFLRQCVVPAPSISEQRRIAAILDEADALRSSASTAISLLEECEDAAFRAAVPVSASTPLADLVEEFRYGTSAKAGAAGAPILGIPNVTGRDADTRVVKRVELVSGEAQRLRLSDRDVLFVRTNGNPKIIGRASAFASVTGSESEPWVFASYLIRARLVEGVDPDAVVALSRTPLARRHLTGSAATSAGQYNISIPTLRSLPAFAPRSEGQREFARANSAIRERKEAGTRRLQQSEALFASLQHRAFRGEL